MYSSENKLKPCPFPASDSCEICPPLYFYIDGNRDSDRICHRYSSLDAQKQAIRDQYPEHDIQFEKNPYQRKRPEW